MHLRNSILIALAVGCGGTTNTSAPVTGAPQDSAGEAPSAPVEGNLGLPAEREPAPGLTTGGQPDRETLARAASAGVTMIITLRTPDEPGFEEERRTVDELGMAFVSVPVSGPADLTIENAEAVDRAIESASGPVVLHCGSGNRAGAMIALRAFHVQGLPAEEAVKRGIAAGLTKLEGAVRSHFERFCHVHPEARPCAE